MNRYILSSEATQKVKKSPLFRKIQRYKKKNGGFYPCYSTPQNEDFLNDISNLPKKLSYLKEKLLEILENIDDFSWSVGKGGFQGSLYPEIDEGEHIWKEKVSSITHKDLVLITGYRTLDQILNVKDILNYEKNGFKNEIDLLLTIGAYIDCENNKYIEKKDEYSFKNKETCSRIVITGDMHGDFRFYKLDEKYYDTYSPLGKIHGVSPIKSIQSINLYHSSEISFLGEILKYAFQIGYKISLKKILNFADKLPNLYGNFGEMGGDDFGDRFGISSAYYSDIPEEKGTRFIGDYSINLNTENNLVFSHISNNKNYPDTLILKEDIDIIIKGLLHQAAYGHGRTSKKRVLDVLQYAFSEEFKKELDKFKQ